MNDNIADTANTSIALRLAQHFLARQKVLERYIELCPVPCCILEKNGQITFANEALHQMLGAGFDQLTGQGFWSFVHPEDLVLVQKAVQSLEKGETQRFFQRIRLKHASEQILAALTVIAPVRGNGMVGYLIPCCDRSTCPVKALAETITGIPNNPTA